MSETVSDMRMQAELIGKVDAVALVKITRWADEFERLERSNAALLAAAKAVVSRAKERHLAWDNDELNDSHFGKHLLALAGYNKGYHKAYDGFHDAISQAEANP